ncbi:MAG: Fuseless [Candidatus Parcubacteria bacterium]|jgi:hypothetical protein
MLKVRKNLGYLVIAVGIVLIWRGVWGLADILLVPNIPVLSFLLSILLGVLLLLIHKPKQFDLDELE